MWKILRLNFLVISSEVLFTSSLLLLTNFCFNYYLDNNSTTFFLISLPLWISLLFNIHHENRSCIILENIVSKYKLNITKNELEIINDFICRAVDREHLTPVPIHSDVKVVTFILLEQIQHSLFSSLRSTCFL
eukprot:SAG31_NODE_20_length_34168_cov_33.651296_25_plen_133_part_00